MLPYGKQLIDQDDIDEVVRVLKGDYLTTGPEIEKFEQALCKFTDAPFAVVSSNGTAALHIACMAMGLVPGDQVIVPTISFVATANAAQYCGAEVVFADVDPETSLMTPETLREAIARSDKNKLKAIFVVHMGGHVADIVALNAIADELGVYCMEDACHALGSRYSDPNGAQFKAGSCSHCDFSTISFHPVKTITSGEGGVTFTNNPDFAKAMKLARSHGITRDDDDWQNNDLAFDDDVPNPWYYEQPDLGYNYRMTDFQAALGCSQLKKMPFFAEQRQKLAVRYHVQAEGENLPFSFVGTPMGGDSVQHLMVALIDFEKVGLSRREVMMALRSEGVGTQVHYVPIHHQPYYAKMNPGLELPGADAYYARCLSVPLYPAMSEQDVDRVVAALHKVVGAALT